MPENGAKGRPKGDPDAPETDKKTQKYNSGTEVQKSCRKGLEPEGPRTSKSVLAPRRGAICFRSCFFVIEPISDPKNFQNGSQHRIEILRKCIPKFDQNE